MLKYPKITGVITALCWLMLVVFVGLTEVFNYYMESMKIGVYVFIALLVLFHGYFVLYFLKNKTKIENLQNDYIKTLKPDKPLRFCPSDSELMKEYELGKQKKPTEAKPVIQEKVDQDTNEDSEEIML